MTTTTKTMNRATNPFLLTHTVIAVLLVLMVQAAIAAPTLTAIEQQWDITNFTLTGDAQIAAFEQLQADSEAYTTAHPAEAEGWIWRGIIDSSFAGAKGGLGALGLAKSARKYFDKAIDIDGDAMQGSAYSSLGTLYYSVPGWPVGFGDDDKAEELLQKGLSLNPDGIDSNYFYAEFLANQKKPSQAVEYYRKALNAPPREGRAVADDGRRKQAQSAISNIEA
jgi:tetratricopeptide (TPR) repeat protein